MNESDLPLQLADRVELVMYSQDQSCSVEVLETNGLLADFEKLMARVNADVQAEPASAHAWVEIFPCEAEQLLFAVTLIYTGSEDFRGSLAAAQYSGAAEAASVVLYSWCERNAMIEVEDLLRSAEAVTGLN
jgi:hypothetical protein